MHLNKYVELAMAVLFTLFALGLPLALWLSHSQRDFGMFFLWIIPIALLWNNVVQRFRRRP